jgi:hypothetical protein
MDSFIYALVLSPPLTELLPKSGMANTPENVGLAGSILFAFALFLVGWDGAFPLSGDLWRIASVARAYLRRRFLLMHFSLVRQLGHKMFGNSRFSACWLASE